MDKLLSVVSGVVNSGLQFPPSSLDIDNYFKPAIKIGKIYKIFPKSIASMGCINTVCTSIALPSGKWANEIDSELGYAIEEYSLNASKTRLIEFGRFTVTNRRKRGFRKSETFDLLGFTHCCSVSRRGDFQVLRLTVKKRMRATFLAIREELSRRRHNLVRVQEQWLKRVVSGYFNYHAVSGNMIRLGGFRLAVCRHWRQALKRSSQRNRLQWSRYGCLADFYILRSRNAHLYPGDEDEDEAHRRRIGEIRKLCPKLQCEVVNAASPTFVSSTAFRSAYGHCAPLPRRAYQKERNRLSPSEMEPITRGSGRK